MALEVPNNLGWVNGDANLAADQTEHAFLWRDAVMTDLGTVLGTVGGLNSSVSFPVKDDRGLITGVPQTAIFDPLGELLGSGLLLQHRACEGYQNLEVGFLWPDGVMTRCPHLAAITGWRREPIPGGRWPG